MAGSSEIRFRIGADTSALSRGFVQAQSIAAAASKSISRQFDLKNSFNRTVLALGLSIENISTKIAEMFTGGSSWRDALQTAEEISQLIEERTMRRMDLLKQIEHLEKKIRNNTANENPAPRKNEGFLARIMNSPLSAIGSLGLSKVVGSATGLTEETEQERFARSQKAQAQNLADQNRMESLQERRAQNEEKIAHARRELERMTMSDQEQAFALETEMLDLQQRAAAAKKSGKDATDLELAALAKEKAVNEKLLEISRKTTEDMERQEQVREQILDKFRSFLEASDGVGRAKSEASDARHDALAFTVAEAASGERGNPADRHRARAILRDEARARRLFDSGATVTEFDTASQTNVQRGAAFFAQRALDMRSSFSKLTSSDRAPFAGLEKRLDDANKHLAQVEKSLSTVKTKSGP